MKKAEIIKNGNVNLKTVKLDKKVNKEIDWDDVESDYFVWLQINYRSGVEHIPSNDYFEWFKKRLS